MGDKTLGRFPRLLMLCESSNDFEITSIPMFKYSFDNNRIIGDFIDANDANIFYYCCVKTYNEKDAFILAKKSKKIIILINDNTIDGNYRIVSIEDLKKEFKECNYGK